MESMESIQYIYRPELLDHLPLYPNQAPSCIGGLIASGLTGTPRIKSSVGFGLYQLKDKKLYWFRNIDYKLLVLHPFYDVSKDFFLMNKYITMI
jgi:hypothetical protein